MKIKDLIKEKVVDKKTEEDKPFTKKDFMVQYKEQSISIASRLKQANHEYFKASALAINYVNKQVTLCKRIYGYPFYTSGKKGFLLKETVLDIMDKNIRAVFEEAMVKHNSKLVLFPDGILALPEHYIKELRKGELDEDTQC